MVYVTGTCKTCGTIVRLPGTPFEDARQRLEKHWNYPCPGGHRNDGRLLDGFDWDWVPSIPATLPSDEEYASGLVLKYGSDHVFSKGSAPRLEVLGIRDLKEVPTDELTRHWFISHESPRLTLTLYVKLPRLKGGNH